MKNEWLPSKIFNANTYMELLMVALLLVAFLANIQILILAVFAVACILILASDFDKAIYYLAFFTSFAGILVYQGKHMFFVMAALLILKFIIFNKVYKTTLFFYLLIVAYCVAFCDYEENITFANMLGSILLLTIAVVANYADCFDCREFMKHYILGFVIATIIGFFVKEIPAMIRLFQYDLYWTQSYQELTRFFGLAFDSNFYALSNYTILAYLLMGFKKLDRFRTGLVLFLIIAGLQTLSKSYLLVLVLLMGVYFIKNISSVSQFMYSIIIGVLGIALFIYISDSVGYNVVDLILGRFVAGGSFADNTTNRVDIWERYFEDLANADMMNLIFGFGFNTKLRIAAHNTFIEFLYAYGIIGFGMWILYFIHCGRLFREKTKAFAYKSPMVSFCFVLGVFFLSALTYEAFWIGIAISFMTLGKGKEIEGEIHEV